jgi:exonuclease V gamma subunit
MARSISWLLYTVATKFQRLFHAFEVAQHDWIIAETARCVDIRGNQRWQPAVGSGYVIMHNSASTDKNEIPTAISMFLGPGNNTRLLRRLRICKQYNIEPINFRLTYAIFNLQLVLGHVTEPAMLTVN